MIDLNIEYADVSSPTGFSIIPLPEQASVHGAKIRLSHPSDFVRTHAKPWMVLTARERGDLVAARLVTSARPFKSVALTQHAIVWPYEAITILSKKIQTGAGAWVEHHHADWWNSMNNPKGLLKLWKTLHGNRDVEFDQSLRVVLAAFLVTLKIIPMDGMVTTYTDHVIDWMKTGHWSESTNRMTEYLNSEIEFYSGDFKRQSVTRALFALIWRCQVGRMSSQDALNIVNHLTKAVTGLTELAPMAEMNNASLIRMCDAMRAQFNPLDVLMQAVAYCELFAYGIEE